MSRSLIDENEYAAEAASHINWLNWMFGVTLFLFAISAIQFKSPWKICVLGLLLVIPMYIHAFRSFPSTLIALRQLSKDDRNNTELAKLIAHLESKYHSWGAALKLSPLWIALVLYIAVIASGLESFACIRSALLWLQA